MGYQYGTQHHAQLFASDTICFPLAAFTMKPTPLLILCSLLLIQSCVLQTFSPRPDIRASERTITAQGQADINHGGIFLARKRAFKDAMRNTALATANTLAPDSLIASSKVVDEWMADDTYHIQVLSTLSKDKHCHSPYRKRIVATGFPIVTSGQISGHETQDLYAGIPREIMNILLETGVFFFLLAATKHTPASILAQIWHLKLPISKITKHPCLYS